MTMIARTAAALLAAGLVAGAPAQTFPSRPVHIIVPFAAPGTPEQFDALLRLESARYAKVVREAGIKAD